MKRRIRLGCAHCDREDFDGTDSIPEDWSEVTELQSYEEATRPIQFSDSSGSPLNWETHMGICPDCQKEQRSDANG